MSVDWTAEDIARLDGLHYTLAARKIRHVLEKKVVPRVEHMLGRTLKGEAVMGCTHLVDAPGRAHERATIDVFCEDIGLQCLHCAAMHLSDERTPHMDPRHLACIVCGDRDLNALRPFSVAITLRDYVMVTSQILSVFSDITGETHALGYIGALRTTPVTWACERHQDVHDSKVTLEWPPEDVKVTNTHR